MVVKIKDVTDGFIKEIEALKAERDALLAQNKELGRLLAVAEKQTQQLTLIALGDLTIADIQADAIQSIADDELIAHVTQFGGSYNAMLVYDYVQVRAATVRQGGE